VACECRTSAGTLYVGCWRNVLLKRREDEDGKMGLLLVQMNTFILDVLKIYLTDQHSAVVRRHRTVF
jgi:hypothetical protein